ncbi:MAG: Glucose-methanol-choline oxidoreductase:NAD binding site [Acidobacteria bacterium]|nr:Glucose-methanol-choline oxidoreductase:NAD binding site [Acidobacteriota bacterium]
MSLVYDAVIVGSGAGGGALAWRLSAAGWRVLVLEKGPRFSRADYDHGSGLGPGGFGPAIDGDPHTVVTARTTVPVRTTLGWIATCVGGGTVHMGGYFYRFHPDDFRMRSRFGDYLSIADWPYGYAELEPYYVLAERMMGVSGLAGADPFAGARSAAYPLPPLEAHPFAAEVERACGQRGWHPFPTPRAVNSRPYDGRPACAYCRVCASYGCPVGARGTSQETFIAHAEATGRCEVRPLSMVREVVSVEGDRVSGCVYVDAEGREQFAAGAVVCISASAVESARLLLLSRSARFPDGIGNEHGQVGRNLQFHAVTMGEALFALDRTPAALLHDPFPFLGRSLSDFYFLPKGVSDLAKGGMIRFGIAPRVPGGYLTPSAEQRVLYFEAFHDFLPNEQTFVTLDDAVTDRWGLPAARIHLDLPPHHRRAGRFLADRAFEVYEDLGATEGVTTDVGGTSAYLVHGTCRAGLDPRTSVVDRFCRVHGVRNLYVADGSFMPTSGGASTTLTIVANALRTADHILTRAI